MRLSEGLLLLSPSDVVDATACDHRAATALRVAHGVAAREPSTAMASVLHAGAEHEARVVDGVRATGARVLDLSGATPDLTAWRALAAATLAAVRGGAADVVLQAGVTAALPGGALLVGRPDLLVATPDGWRVEDAKLARSLQPSALLQTCLYRDALAAAGARVHDDVRLHLGDGAVLDVPARDAASWARRQVAEVLALLERLRAGGALEPDHVVRVAWCSACEDDSPCGRQRAAQDHLSGVADMRRTTARHLAAAGIDTLAGLAASDGPVRGVAPAVLDGFREQARLQLAARTTGELPVVVRPHPASVPAGALRPGLWAVPDPDPGDVFFDMEGDPLWTPGDGRGGRGGRGGTGRPGLEYLFGATHDGGRFTAFWAHDRTQEGAAFAAFVDWVQARRERHPGMHVHHYAAYEQSALRRLAAQHATRGDVVDAWLADGVLVDLYTAVRGGLRAGVPSYSIKKVEALYGAAHTGEVATAGASIEVYERWRATREPQLLDDIEAYNRDDCDSTRDLRDYLLRLRAEAVADGRLAALEVQAPLTAPLAEEAPASDAAALRARLAARAAELLDGADPSAPAADPAGEARRVLAGLLGVQVREEKAAWQDVFRTAEDVAADASAAVEAAKPLGGLVATGEVLDQPGRGVAWAYRAPAQEHAVEVGAVQACVAGRPVGASVRALDADGDGAGGVGGGGAAGEAAGGLRVVVALSAERAAAGGWSPTSPPPVDALLGDAVVRAEAQQRSLLELADDVGPVDSPAWADPAGPRAAARALLAGRASLALPALPPALPGEDGVAHAARLALGSLAGARGGDGAEEHGPGLCLAVQGPPGAGKSHLGAEVVDALLARAAALGRPVRVGVTANSHEVVRGLLRSVHRRTPSAVVRHYDPSASKARAPARWARLCDHEGCDPAPLATGHREGWAAGQVVGGTAWAFARDDAPALDVLVVDEAGQMGLGDVLACARDVGALLLLGDPQQLPKPVRAAHPDGVAVSALEHLVRGAATMPPEVGVFLDATRRMHPDLTRFVSAVSYDGRLGAHPVCSTRAVVGRGPGEGDDGGGGPDALVGTGLRWVPVEHDGAGQSSAAEVAAVVAVVRQLLGRWRRRGGSGPGAGDLLAMTPDQVLVVSPFTAQVRLLASALAAAGLGAVAVGTVDRFQGKEATAVVYSTAASDAEQAPRGLEFLYDLHRLNVAVSRAQCLAVWVGSPALLRPRVTSAAQVPLVNALCRFAEDAVVVPLPPTG